MRAFEISLNGKKLCVAGVGKHGYISAYLTYKDEPAERIWITVCGYVRPKQLYVKWRETDLKAGDEILVRIVERKKVDRYRSSYPNPSLKQQIATQKRVLREQAKRLGWEIVESPKSK